MIGKKNSGFFKQDAVMGKLSADARRPHQVNAIVAQALEEGRRRKAYVEERAKNQVPRFVKQYSVSLKGPGSDVRAFLGKKRVMYESAKFIKLTRAGGHGEIVVNLHHIVKMKALYENGKGAIIWLANGVGISGYDMYEVVVDLDLIMQYLSVKNNL